MHTLTRRGFAAAAPLALAAGSPARAQPATAWPDATEMAARIRRGELTALAAVQAAIDGALKLQPTLNFLVASDFDRALETARRRPAPGPFAGVPFLIKDLNFWPGTRTRMGSRSGFLPPLDPRQVSYMDAFAKSGVVVVGKSSTPEFGFLPTTEPLAFGPTRNPWDITRSSGGSSGGSAAAVAAGVVPFAHANDGGGSIRIPASCCGLFGLKPSRGRMIVQRGEKAIAEIAVDHVVTRSVRDSAAMFAATEDTAPGAVLPPVGFVTEPLKRRLRVGLVIDGAAGDAPSPEVRAATISTARLLESLGHRVIPTKWPMSDSFIRDFLLLWAEGAAGLATGIERATGRKPDEAVMEPFSLGMVEMFRKEPRENLPKVLQRLEAAAAAYDPWFTKNRFDVILSPVLQTPAPKLGFVGPSVEFDTLIERLTDYVGYTPYHNIVGAPAMSVPLYWTDDGLPVGSQFAARIGQEGLLFQLAYQLEAARPWAARLPPVRV